MKYYERKQNLNYLLDLIEKERCFTIEFISEKFNCSVRTAKRMIAELKEEGNDINFCRIEKNLKKKFIVPKFGPVDVLLCSDERRATPR
jgi:predicted DNA-binding transcriptional regulator YafY